MTQGASSLDPAATSPTVLASGTDDHANVTATEYTAALNLLTKDLRARQVSIPGATSATLHAPLLAHALTRNRVPLLDASTRRRSRPSPPRRRPTGRSTVPSSRACSGRGRPSPASRPGTTRTVPYSAVEAGIIARNDGAGLSANIAAAGDKGFAQWATGLSQAAPTSANWDTLADAGVNVARMYGGRVQTYGFDTLANPATEPRWTQLSGSRLNTLIAALAMRSVSGSCSARTTSRASSSTDSAAALTGMLLAEADPSRRSTSMSAKDRTPRTRWPPAS
jgi:hypothetical protein